MRTVGMLIALNTTGKAIPAKDGCATKTYHKPPGSYSNILGKSADGTRWNAGLGLVLMLLSGCVLACDYGYHDSFKDPGVFRRLPEAGDYGGTSLYPSTNPNNPSGLAASRGGNLFVTFFTNDTIAVSYNSKIKSDNAVFEALEAIYSDLRIGTPPAGARGGNWYNLC